MTRAGAARRVVAIDDGYEDYSREAGILAGVGASFEVIACGGDAAAIAGRIRDADALLVRESKVSGGVIESMPNLKAIVRYGIGVDNIDIACATRRRVAVANIPDYGTEDVSDQAVALLMAVARHVVTRDRDVRNGRWAVGRAEPMFRFVGKTVGMLGYGRIARAFERKLRAFRVGRVLVYDPYAQLPAGVESLSPEQVCAQSDYLAVHAPLTPQTHHLLNAERIALLKPNCIVVNTARGALIDEAALVRALQERRIFGAGLDVFEREPLPADSPLMGLPNVVLSDHTGWYSEESVRDLQEGAAHEAARVLRGERPQNWLNPW